MTADLLRRAAALMRERAEATVDMQGGDWRAVEYEGTEWAGPSYCIENGEGQPLFDEIGNGPDEARRALAEHIASWHPAVALAVADWLDSVVDAVDGTRPSGGSTIAIVDERHALTIARTYIGQAPS